MMIDFSPKHDVLIRNPDGSLQPMDEPYFEPLLIAPDTWRILSDGDYQYLVAGEREAIAIDTGYGAGDIRANMQTLTDKPLRYVINTHDHFDHTANNCYFEKAYMTAATQPLATVPSPSFAGISFPRDYPVEIVQEGYVFDLGGRTLEVLEMNFHAAGSLLLLDRKARILFSGDEIFDFGMNLRNGRTVEEYVRKLSKIMAHREEFDHICGGPVVMLNASVLDTLQRLAESVLNGAPGEPVPAAAPAAAAPAPAQDSGVKIYNRMMPRPEDRGKGGAADDAPYRRQLQVDGVCFSWDSRYLFEQGEPETR